MNGHVVTAAAMAGMLVASASDVFALAGKLDRPGISIPVVERDGESVHDPVVKAIDEVLKRKDWTFAGGYFVNWSTWLRYQGDAEELSAFLKALSEIDGARVTVTFARDSGKAISAPLEGADADADWQWSVSHVNLEENATLVVVTIYLGENGVDLEDVVFPPIHGRPTK
jgi:hypothetical protein